MTWSPRTPKKVTECIPQDTRGPKRLWDAPAGWVMRTRGDTGGTRPMEFRCPVHGQFVVEVPRGEDPDAVACPEIVEHDHHCQNPPCGDCGFTTWACDEPSPWSPSTFGIWASAGEVTS